MVAELFDADNTRAVSRTFTTTTDWSRIEIDFGADTTGAFDDDNNLSLYVALWLAGGSAYSGGTLQTSWVSSTAANRAAGSSNFFDSTDNTLFITGMQLEVGSVATEFEHRSFGEELALCQRYFIRYPSLADASTTMYYALGMIHSSSVAFYTLNLPVPMRTQPDLSISGTADFTSVDSGTIKT